jgi:ribosomal RNA assembly protein
MQESIRIPKNRIAVLIGEKGQIKRRIQKKTNTQIHIDSKEGEVTITSGDGLNILIAKNIIQAIARGFNPDIAEQLYQDDIAFELMDITDFARNKQDVRRVKSRVIGADGKARTMLENLTGTSIVVYGKTVGIIGGIKEVNLARRALISLLNGSKHGNVYAMINKEKKKDKEIPL